MYYNCLMADAYIQVMNQNQRYEVLECTLESDHDSWVAEQFGFVALAEGELLPSLANLAGISHLVPNNR